MDEKTKEAYAEGMRKMYGIPDEKLKELIAAFIKSSKVDELRVAGKISEKEMDTIVEAAISTMIDVSFYKVDSTMESCAHSTVELLRMLLC